MHTVASGSKVLVTGINGYVAMWVTHFLLEQGYFVRGTIRSASKGEYIRNYFKAKSDKLELVTVADIEAEGAFDEAVKGVDAVEHIASPFHASAIDPDEIIKPAVLGTVNLLQSVLKCGSSVKRVVITSSSRSVTTPLDKPGVYNEKDWNETSTRLVREKGKDAHPVEKYYASKTLAEKAAWEFVEKNKEQIANKWDLTTINPSLMIGPPIQEVNGLQTLNASLRVWYGMVVADTPKTKESLADTDVVVDVRDVAEAHVRALQKEAAGGERILLSKATFTWQEWLDCANGLSPSPIPSHKLPLGEPGLRSEHKITYNSTKIASILGLQYRSVEEMTRDTLAMFEKLKL